MQSLLKMHTLYPEQTTLWMHPCRGLSVFSTINLSSGYWQVQLEGQDIAKTAFTISRGIYSPCGTHGPGKCTYHYLASHAAGVTISLLENREIAMCITHSYTLMTLLRTAPAFLSTLSI